MASLRVPTADFQTGHFPEVCALTGYLAESRYRLVAAGSPLVAGAIPLSEEAAKGLQRRKVVALGLVFAALVLGVLGVATGITAVSVLGLVLLITGVVLTRRLSRALTAKVIGDKVEINGVHDDFWRAVARPSKCADCTGKATCDVTAMLACDEHGEVIGAAHD